MLFEIPTGKIKPAKFYSAACKALPVGVGLGMLTHRVNNQVIVEAVLDSESTCSRIISSGLVVDDQLTLYPVRPLPPDYEVTRLKLSQLPILPKTELEAGLRRSLTPFGQVVQLGLYEETNGGWFLGRSYAVLVHRPGQHYQELCHRISYGVVGTTERSFYATWENMGTYCRYCHETDHSIQACPTRPVRTCYNCHRPGHIAVACPHPPSALAHKKPRVAISETSKAPALSATRKKPLSSKRIPTFNLPRCRQTAMQQLRLPAPLLSYLLKFPAPLSLMPTATWRLHKALLQIPLSFRRLRHNQHLHHRRLLF